MRAKGSSRKAGSVRGETAPPGIASDNNKMLQKSIYAFALFGKSKSYLNEVGDCRQVPAVSRALQHAERPGRAEDELALPLGVVAGGGGAEGEVLGLEAAALALRGQPCSRLRKLNV